MLELNSLRFCVVDKKKPTVSNNSSFLPDVTYIFMGKPLVLQQIKISNFQFLSHIIVAFVLLFYCA